MKYIKDFDSIIEGNSTENLDEATKTRVNASGYIKAGKLGVNDQFLGRRSLSWTLSVDLGLPATDQFVGPWIGFDHVSMYAVGKRGGTILDDALTNKYTYEELKVAAAKYLGIKESVNENAKATAKEIFDELMDVNGEEIADMDKSECMYTLKMRGITGGEAAKVCKELLKMTSSIGESVDLTEAAKLMDEETGKIVKLPYKTKDFRGDPITVKGFTEPHKASSSGRIQTDKGEFFPGVANCIIVGHKYESMNEAKKFKPGDMWSDDFDYEGMLKYGLKVNEKTPIKMLNKLFDSATDVNYHTPFRSLGIAIDWIEDGDKKGAKDYIKNFHDDIKKEMKDQGIK